MLAKVPALQGVGDVEPAAHEPPGSHAVHSETSVRLVLLLNVPEGQLEGTAVASGQYIPARHGRQAVWPESGCLVPGAQL